MTPLRKRLDALEAAAPAGAEHWVLKCHGWDEEAVLDHYGRDRVGPDDKIIWVLWGREGGEPLPYPAGYFDSDGRWAEICAARGLPHRDHAK